MFLQMAEYATNSNVEIESIQKVHKWQECVLPSHTFVCLSKNNVTHIVYFEIGNTALPHWCVFVGESYHTVPILYTKKMAKIFSPIASPTPLYRNCNIKYDKSKSNG